MAKQTFTTGSVLTAAQMNSLQANDYNWTVSQKTASYVLVAADAGTRIEMNSGSATTITVNTGLFAAGDTLFIQNIGAGVTTVTAGTATVQKSANASLALAQYQGGYLYFISASNAVFFADAGFTSPLTTKGDLFTWDTGNARLAVGTNGQVLTADSTAATGLKWAAAGGGKVLQVIESTTTTYATNSTSTYADTGVSVSITPSASTSKVLVFANVFAMKSGSNSGSSCQLTLLRGSTVINGTGDYNLYTATAMPLPVMTTLMKLDSPSTTSSTTYKVQFRNPANVAAAIINNYNSDTTNLPVSSIIALEIGA